MNPFSLRYPFAPPRRSLATGRLSDLFGLSSPQPPLVIAENLSLELKPSDVVLFQGPSGTGKSTLLREVSRQLGALDARKLRLPHCSLIDALPGSFEKRLDYLTSCGLGEPRMMLRSPYELSEGQAYRFRLAYALALAESERIATIQADEFASNLDRTLAKVLAYNVRRCAIHHRIGFLLATAHNDLVEDLRPDLLVQCRGESEVEASRRETTTSSISFASELSLVEGSKSDWASFAKWHYRSSRIDFVKRVVLLQHREEPIGICVFTSPAASLKCRSRYFGLSGPRCRQSLRAINEQLWLLARVVLHPTYRGAGIASRFIAEACRTCPVPWIECLSTLGRVHPVFERAGFQKVGVIRKGIFGSISRGGQFGSKCRRKPSDERSRFSEPAYYVLSVNDETAKPRIR